MIATLRVQIILAQSRDAIHTPPMPTTKTNTPGYAIHLDIALTGRVAYRWSPSGHRWIRMGRADAELFLAAGQATEVPYTGNLAARMGL